MFSALSVKVICLLVRIFNLLKAYNGISTRISQSELSGLITISQKDTFSIIRSITP